MLTYPSNEVTIKKKSDGTLILESKLVLEKVELNYGTKFLEVCEIYSNEIWLAERDNKKWIKITYKEAKKSVLSLSQSLLDIGLNQKKPC